MKLFPCGVVGENSVERKREGGSGDGRECRRGIYGRSMNNGVGDFDTTSFDSGGEISAHVLKKCQKDEPSTTRRFAGAADEDTVPQAPLLAPQATDPKNVDESSSFSVAADEKRRRFVEAILIGRIWLRRERGVALRCS